MSKKILLVVIFVLILFIPIGSIAGEDEIDSNGPDNQLLIPEETVIPDNNYYQGIVTEIIGNHYEEDEIIPLTDRFSQQVKVKILEGPDQNQILELSYNRGAVDQAEQTLKVGEKVLLIQTEIAGEKKYYITDRYRLNKVIWLVLGFFILVFIFAGWKGLSSLLGLASTIAIIIWYILPRIIDGHNIYTTFLVGGFIITIVSIYLGHGLNRRTSVAVLSSLITLTISIGISILAINWAKLFGLGTEEAFYIQVGALADLNLKGLLLGGMIIGILGVLDDITTAQSAAVEEIHKANPNLNFFELVKRGLSVGHEHIISLVNTLALAYLGASFPLLLLFTQSYTPVWAILNSEQIIEEVVRTLVGSSALVFAVPITTYLAAYVFSKYSPKDPKTN